MIEESRNEQTDLGSSLSRRRLLKKAGLLGLGALSLCNAPNKIVPGVEAVELKRSGSQPPARSFQRSRKPAAELLTVLQNHPGGKEALEAAKKGNSRLAMGRLPSNLTRVPPFSVVLSPGHLKEGSNTVTLREVDVLSDTTFELKKVGKTQSHALLRIAFPQYGWYLLNVEGALKPNWGISAGIRQMRSSMSSSGLVIQTWVYPKNTGTQSVVRSFPAVYEYKDSPYNKFGLEFYIESGGFLFQELSVESL